MRESNRLCPGKCCSTMDVTAGAFCHNELEPGYPHRVSVETGFMIWDLTSNVEGIFIDGHERSDVVESRGKFL